jgi:hypothetical protein
MPLLLLVVPDLSHLPMSAAHLLHPDSVCCQASLWEEMQVAQATPAAV